MYFTSTLNRGGQLYAPATLAKNSAQHTLTMGLIMSQGRSGRLQKKIGHISTLVFSVAYSLPDRASSAALQVHGKRKTGGLLI